jgi:lysyl-tRNA synthetase class 2
MSPGSKNSSSAEEQLRLGARSSNLWLRARIIQSIRRFFIEQGYLEIETPHLIPAPAPEVNIDAMSAGTGFLHTSPELCMKRLLAAGYSKIFQICRSFRDRERGDLHLPEFTLLEWYRTGIDYVELMEECEEMILFVTRDLGMEEKIEYGGREIDLKRPWNRISVKEAFEHYAPISMENALESERFNEIMVHEIEPRLALSKPAFLYDYPSAYAALARLRENEPGLAERFELYMGGLEMANAFSELTDTLEQEIRFKKERHERQQLGKTVYPMPEKFLHALQHMPPSAGIALGVDRLIMLFANQGTIDNVVSFTPEEL